MGFLDKIEKKWNDFVLNKLQKQILNNTEKYINKKHSLKKWVPGKDWVQYSGPYFDSKEYKAAVNSLSVETLWETAIIFLYITASMPIKK